MKLENAAVRPPLGTDGLILDTMYPSSIKDYPDNLRNATRGYDGAQLPDRFRIAEEFEQRVWNWLCRSRQIGSISRTGFEHLMPDQQFRECLRNVKNPLVNQYRYSPDFLTISNTGKLSYIEVKRSLHIEKDAYEHYCNLDKITPIWLIIESDGEVFWQRISYIGFIDSLKHVDSFPVPFPVDSDGWIIPKPGKEHSSCRFRVIDITSMKALDLDGEL